MAVKIARAFDVPIDYLLGEDKQAAYYKETVKRLEDIERLDPDAKQHIFFLMDNLIQNFKTKKAFAK